MKRQFNSNNFGISDKSYFILIDYLHQFKEIENIKIFGSRAKGTTKNGSDIDLAFFGKNISENQIWHWAGHINESLPIPYKVDLVHFENLQHDGLKQNIINIGKNFIENNQR